MTLVFFLSESKNGGGYLEIEVDDNNGYRPVVGDIVELDEYIEEQYNEEALKNAGIDDIDFYIEHDFVVAECKIANFRTMFCECYPKEEA